VEPIKWEQSQKMKKAKIHFQNFEKKIQEEKMCNAIELLITLNPRFDEKNYKGSFIRDRKKC